MAIKPLENVRIEQDSTPGLLRIYADVFFGKASGYAEIYALKSIGLEDTEDRLREIVWEGCADLLANRYGANAGKPGGPWRDIYWAYRADINRKIREAVNKWRLSRLS